MFIASENGNCDCVKYNMFLWLQEKMHVVNIHSRYGDVCFIFCFKKLNYQHNL